MRTFEYASASDLADALTRLDHTRPLAGGTDLLPLMKADITAPEHVLDLKRVPELDGGISSGPDGLTLGALTRLSAIESDPAIQARYTALAEAAGLAATPQLRNMATLGGNLLQRPRCWYYRSAQFHCWLRGGAECHAREGENQLHAIFGDSPCVAVHPSDPPAALLAFDAQLRLISAAGQRDLPLEAFFSQPTDDHRLENQLNPGELIHSIRLPAPAEGTRSTYLKAMNRKVWAFALIGVAALVRLDAAERVADARIVLNGVAPIPWRSHSAERALHGSSLDDETCARAADAALAEAHPLARNGYKIPLARGLIRQALASSR